jgi:hypothetical protein
MRKFAIALFVGACVLGVAACGGGGGNSANDQFAKAGKKLGISDNGKKITIGDGKNGGKITVGGAELPDGFPSSVPLPSDNKSDIIAGGTVTASGEQTWTVTYKVGEDGAKDYKAKLEDAGFTADSSYSGSSGDAASSYYSLSNATYKVNVIGSTDKSQSAVVITVTPNKDSSTTTTDSGSSTGSGM